MKPVAIFAFVGAVVAGIAAALHVLLVCLSPSQPNVGRWLIAAAVAFVLAVLFAVLGFLARARPKERNHEASEGIHAC